jgi:hypothetical protein
MNLALTKDLASHFARIALGHVTREYPNAPQYVLANAGELAPPSVVHPIFFGSFDWHSCVHGYWLLARLLRRFPDIPEARDITSLFDRQLTPDKVAGEVAYLARPLARGFERPYGWAWALMLAGELHRHTSVDSKRCADALQPLTDAFVTRFLEFLPIAYYPVRAGVHSNTAFALVLALDYAAALNDIALRHRCAEKAVGWYQDDQDCQAWEPSQDEFLSPSLIEAVAVSMVLPPGEFPMWLKDFLPRLPECEPATLFSPALVSDRTDRKIAHLDGLNLSRAWCWRRIAGCLGGDQALCRIAEDCAERHIQAALPHVAGDYMGEHWLASFALLALDPWPDE